MGSGYSDDSYTPEPDGLTPGKECQLRSSWGGVPRPKRPYRGRRGRGSLPRGQI